MAGVERLMIVGPSGAGKSTLSRDLMPLLELPVIHLDQGFWKEGWVPSELDEWDRRLETIMSEQERWIMDGNYGSSFHLRMPRAQVIVFLDYPPRVYRFRVLKRIWTYHGKVRPDLSEGCPEKLDWEFLRWVWGFHRSDRPKILRALKRYVQQQVVFWLRHPSERDELVELLVKWQHSGKEEAPESKLRWDGVFGPQDLSLL